MLENQKLIVVSFFGFSSPQLQVSIFVLGSFLVGTVVGGLLMSASALRRRAAGDR
nr:LapA family protein [Pseudomonas sp. PMCC200367]